MPDAGEWREAGAVKIAQLMQMLRRSVVGLLSPGDRGASPARLLPKAA